MTPDALQAVYDRILAGTERATPRPLLSAAARDWFGRMRRLRWVAAWLEQASPGTSSPLVPPPLPPPPPPPPGGGVDDFVVNPTDQPITIRMDAEWNDEDQGTDTTLGPSDGEADQGAGPSDQGTPITLVPTDNTDNPTDASAPTWLEQVNASAAAITTSRTIYSAPPAGEALSLSFGAGALSPSWTIYAGQWSQTGGELSCIGLTAGKALLTCTAVTGAADHSVSITRPTGGAVAQCGPACCLSQNPDGTSNGYAAIFDGTNATAYRIDAGVWTSLGSAAFGTWNDAASMSLARVSNATPAQDTGFTVPSASGDSRIVYVSTSGSDANDGLSAATPKATITAAYNLLRDGYPDWLLLKRGDSWTNPGNPGLINWRKSGRSAAEPMVIGSYGSGTVRPQIRPTDTNGFSKGGVPSLNYLNILGLDLYALNRSDANQSSGISMIGDHNTVLVEDCIVRGFHNCVNANSSGGGIPFCGNLTFRRNIFVDSYSGGGANSNGFFASGVTGLTMEENFFDHNGWDLSKLYGAASDLNHNVYIQTTCTGVVCTGNISMRASAHGWQLRPGGTFSRNLLVQNPLGALIGGGDSPVPGGVTAIVTNNLCLESTDTPGTGAAKGFGLDLKNIASGTVTNNIVANKIGTNAQGYAIGSLISGPSGVGVTNTTVSGNRIYNWPSGLKFGDAGQTYTNVVVSGNTVEDRTATASRALASNSRGSWADVTWSGNTYVGSIAAPFYISGYVDFSTWAAAAGEVGSTYAVAPSAAGAVPAFTAALATITGNAVADIDAAAALYRSRGLGKWDPAIQASMVYDYFNGTGGAGGVQISNAGTPVLTATDNTYTSGFGGVAAMATGRAAAGWSKT